MLMHVADAEGKAIVVNTDMISLITPVADYEGAMCVHVGDSIITLPKSETDKILDAVIMPHCNNNNDWFKYLLAMMPLMTHNQGCGQ